MSTNPKMYPKQDTPQPVKTAGLARRMFALVKRVFVKDKGKLALSNPATLLSAEDVPTYKWSLGSSAGGGGMTTAYLDKQYPNLLDGDLPLDDGSMPKYTDVHGDTYEINPTKTSVEIVTDYWEEYGSAVPDPYTKPGEGSPAP